MNNTIAHHPLTDAQPGPEVWCPLASFAPVYMLSMTSYSTDYHLGQLRLAVLAVSLPIPLCLPTSLLAGQLEKLKSPWLSVSTAQQHPNQQCVIMMLILSPNHSTEPATGKNTDFIPAKIRTKRKVIVWHKHPVGL